MPAHARHGARRSRRGCERIAARAAEPARADARRLVGGLRAHDPPLVGAGARDDGRAGAGGPADVLRLLQPALDGQPALRHRPPARAGGHGLGGARRARRTCAPSWPRSATAARTARGRTSSTSPPATSSRRSPAAHEGAPLRGGARGRHHAHLLAHRAARLRAGHRARLARPALARPAARRPRRGAARPLPGGDRQHRVPARPRRVQHPARDHRGARHAARRLHPRQGGDAQRRRRRRDDLVGHPRRALGLDLLARQRVLRRRHRALPDVRLRAWTTSARSR